MPKPHAGKRKLLDFSIKQEVVKRKEEGQGNSAIGRALGLSESTVRTIWKKKDEIKASVKAYGTSQIDNRKRAWDEKLMKMERFLALWIERKEKEGSSVDKRQIKQQAKSFYEVICLKTNVPVGNFHASNGWLQRFLKRKEIKKLGYSGETASADANAAKEFPSILKEMIDEGKFHPDCIYNMDEAGLMYKMPPKSMFVAKQIKKARGRKADKARMTVLFCCNLTGSHKMKPLIIHTAKHPRCYRHLKDMSQAPVHWMTTKNGWMSSSTCRAWLFDCFVPDARWKCEQLGIPFNVMLIMDNCPAHPHYLTDLHPNVKIVFLPPKTTSIVQPLDQEFIGNVKAKYQKLVYEDLRLKTECGAEIHQIITETNGEYQDADIDVDEHPPIEVEETDQLIIQQYTNPKAISIHQYWREFTVRNAIDFLLKAWDEINMPTVRHAWRPLVPHLVADERGGRGQVQTHSDSLMEAAAAACHVPGFENVTAEEINEVNTAGDTMTPEVIMDVATVEDVLENENKSTEVEAPPPGELTMQQLSTILAGVDTFKECITENENCNVRITEMMHQMDKVMRYYTDLHSKKVNERRQTLITKFIRTPAAATPPPPHHHQDSLIVQRIMMMWTSLDLRMFYKRQKI